MPSTIVFTMMLLLGITSVGLAYASATLIQFWLSRNSGFPISLVWSIIVYCIVPVLAFIDLNQSRSSGRYLALLSLLSVWGVFLRWLSFTIFGPSHFFGGARFVPFVFLTVFSLVVSMAALILTLGFSKKVDEYFATEQPSDKFLSHTSPPEHFLLAEPDPCYKDMRETLSWQTIPNVPSRS